jgi:hypothetical protein
MRQELRKPIPPVIKNYTTNPDAVPAPTTKSLTINQLNQYQADYKVYKDKQKDWKLK